MNKKIEKIKEILQKPFTKYEKLIVDNVNDEITCISQLYKKLRNVYKNDIDYQPKTIGKNKGQYGYYISEYCGSLVILMKRLKLKSLLDLGSGPGLILNPIKRNVPHSRCVGYEIEEELVNIGNSISYLPILRKDILKITKEDIKDFQVIYFWEPLKDEVLAKKFVENLSKIVIPNQIICYKPAGFIYNFLRQNSKFTEIKDLHSYSFQIFITN